MYDALGRRVAQVFECAVPASGMTASLDGAGLPAGVYVVHARVTTDAGAVQTLVQRVTLTR